MQNSSQARRLATGRPHVVASLFVCLLFMLVFSNGCIRRRLTVRSNPPGAATYVDGQFIGNTPVSASYIHEATRRVELVHPEYRTEKIYRKLGPRWYEIPPLDFFFETLWPWEIRDERIIDVTLVPKQTLADEELISRANGLRLQSSQGLATGLPPTAISSPSTFQQDGTYPTGPVVPGITGPELNSSGPVLPPWRPGQLLQDFFQPGGEPVQRIPEASGAAGGGYRPEVPSELNMRELPIPEVPDPR